MAITLRCPDCGKRASVPESDQGQKMLCAACGTQFLVPGTPPVLLPLLPPAAAIPESPMEEPRAAAVPAEGRGLGWAGWLVVGLVATALPVMGGIYAYNTMEQSDRAHNRETAVALKGDADKLLAKRRYPEAQVKYRELGDFISLHDPNDPYLSKLAADSKANQDKVSAAILSLTAARGKPATTAPAVARSLPLPTTRPAANAVPIASTTDSHPTTIEPAPPDVPTTRPATPTARRRPARPPIQPVIDRHGGLTDELIGQAIQQGVDHLIDEFDPTTFQLRNLDDPNHDGADALCVYALMQCGEAVSDPRLNHRGPFMVGVLEAMKKFPMNDHVATYSRGIRSTALAFANRPEDRNALKADVAWLLTTHDHGAYTYNRARPGGGWDNSNSQYGLLGVWSGAEVEIEIPNGYWQDVEKHWQECENSDGSWSYGRRGGQGILTMTCAGVASLFVCHDWLDAPKFGAVVGRDPFSFPLKKGLEWLERGDHCVNLSGYWGYSLYGIERVGLASGFKFFGTHNWYPELSAQVLAQQRQDGSWGDNVNTAYALLFLSRGRHPILMNKLRFDDPAKHTPAYWANRPRDVANLSKYATKELERPINWQVVPLARQWTDWDDSPILYLASHKPPELSDAEVDKIRDFVNAGGMLFVQADGDSTLMPGFARTLATRLFPAYEMEDVPRTHPLFSSLYKLPLHPQLRMVSNGSRILMLFSPTDISRHWQLREQKTEAGKPIYQLGVNMFVYATGKRDLRNRLETNYIPPIASTPSMTIKIARVKYAGNWDPEPYAWTRFARQFQKQTGYALNVQPVAMQDLDAKVYPFAHITGTARYAATTEEVEGIKKYVESGGVLLADLTGGAGPFDESFRTTILARAFPDINPKVISSTSPLLNPGPPGMEDESHPHLRPYAVERIGNGPALPAGFAAGKGHVIFTSLDITSGLLNTTTWGIVGYEPLDAQRLMKNAILWTVDGQREGN
ncbi:MAG: A-macroglobulin complement component [Phycisphaerales bacterium]|nr:A-macroglobulin complement component [Phycisphaerales bacterium]